MPRLLLSLCPGGDAGLSACLWVHSIPACVLSAARPGAHRSLPVVIYLVLMSQGLPVFSNFPTPPRFFALRWGRAVLLKKCWYMLLFHASP